jgi:hypothetical protein
MEFNINDEIANAMKDFQELQEKYFAAKGKIDYLQSIAMRLQNEIQQQNENHNENNSGVITQQELETLASSVS